VPSRLTRPSCSLMTWGLSRTRSASRFRQSQAHMIRIAGAWQRPRLARVIGSAFPAAGLTSYLGHGGHCDLKVQKSGQRTLAIGPPHPTQTMAWDLPGRAEKRLDEQTNHNMHCKLCLKCLAVSSALRIRWSYVAAATPLSGAPVGPLVGSEDHQPHAPHWDAPPHSAM
jgi:hypothetical protein